MHTNNGIFQFSTISLVL